MSDQRSSRRRIEVSGGELDVIDVGEGPGVVLLHGFPTSSALWRGLVPLLAERFRVLAPDLLGYGESSARVSGTDLGIRAQAGYVRELIDEAGLDRVAVVGHAHGGGIAQLLVLGGAPVDTVVLVSSIAFDAWPVGATPELAARAPESLAPDDAESWVRHALRSGVAAVPIDEGAVSTYVRPWRRDPSRLVRAAAALDGAGLTGHEDVFSTWTLPVLMLWGEEDPFLPPRVGERLNDAIPSSSLGLVPESGHFLPEEAPETIYPLIAEYLRVQYVHAPHGHAAADRLVMLQLERRPAWVDLAEHDRDELEPTVPDPSEQEVGPGA